jgi:hypothetical protein
VRIARIASAAAIAVGLALSAPVSAQPTQTFDAAEVAAFYTSLAQQPAELRALLEELYGPLQDDIAGPLIATVAPLFGDPAYAAYILDRLPDLRERGFADHQDAVAVFTLLGEAELRGALRLSQKSQETFLATLLDAAEWARATPGYCDTMMALADQFATEVDDLMGPPAPETLTAILSATTAGQAFYADNAGALERQYAFLAAAITAEIHDSPPMRSFDSARAEQVGVDYAMAMIARISAMPNASALMAAMVAMAQDPGAVDGTLDAAGYCDLNIATYAALADLPVEDRGIMVASILTAMRDSGTVQALVMLP